VTPRTMLMASLETFRRDTMLALADDAAERGDEALEQGWRWLALSQRWPCFFRCRIRGHEWWGWRCGGPGFAHNLPGKVFNSLKQGRQKTTWRRYAFLAIALESVAQAAGEVIRDGRMKTF
jgi:hypothetical protein